MPNDKLVEKLSRANKVLVESHNVISSAQELNNHARHLAMLRKGIQSVAMMEQTEQDKITTFRMLERAKNLIGSASGQRETNESDSEERNQEESLRTMGQYMQKLIRDINSIRSENSELLNDLNKSLRGIHQQIVPQGRDEYVNASEASALRGTRNYLAVMIDHELQTRSDKISKQGKKTLGILDELRSSDQGGVAAEAIKVLLDNLVKARDNDTSSALTGKAWETKAESTGTDAAVLQIKGDEVQKAVTRGITAGLTIAVQCREAYDKLISQAALLCDYLEEANTLFDKKFEDICDVVSSYSEVGARAISGDVSCLADDLRLASDMYSRLSSICVSIESCVRVLPNNMRCSDDIVGVFSQLYKEQNEISRAHRLEVARAIGSNVPIDFTYNNSLVAYDGSIIRLAADFFHERRYNLQLLKEIAEQLRENIGIVRYIIAQHVDVEAHAVSQASYDLNAGVCYSLKDTARTGDYRREMPVEDSCASLNLSEQDESRCWKREDNNRPATHGGSDNNEYDEENSIMVRNEVIGMGCNFDELARSARDHDDRLEARSKDIQLGDNDDDARSSTGTLKDDEGGTEDEDVESQSMVDGARVLSAVSSLLRDIGGNEVPAGRASPELPRFSSYSVADQSNTRYVTSSKLLASTGDENSANTKGAHEATSEQRMSSTSGSIRSFNSCMTDLACIAELARISAENTDEPTLKQNQNKIGSQTDLSGGISVKSSSKALGDTLGQEPMHKVKNEVKITGLNKPISVAETRQSFSSLSHPGTEISSLSHESASKKPPSASQSIFSKSGEDASSLGGKYSGPASLQRTASGQHGAIQRAGFTFNTRSNAPTSTSESNHGGLAPNGEEKQRQFASLPHYGSSSYRSMSSIRRDSNASAFSSVGGEDTSSLGGSSRAPESASLRRPLKASHEVGATQEGKHNTLGRSAQTFNRQSSATFHVTSETNWSESGMNNERSSQSALNIRKSSVSGVSLGSTTASRGSVAAEHLSLSAFRVPSRSSIKNLHSHSLELSVPDSGMSGSSSSAARTTSQQSQKGSK